MKLLELFNKFNINNIIDESNLILLEKKRGIIHIEDLPVDEFISKLRNIKNLIISEKIDGANLRFGITKDGKFFTSREAKGGKRYFSPNDYGNKFSDVGFKSAHYALESIHKELMDNNLLFPGDIIEVEILFGKLPNAVPYTGDSNRIILLRPVPTTDDSEEKIIDLENRLEKIKNFLKDKRVTVKVENVPYTDDGETINYRNEIHTWTFSKTPVINIEEFTDKKELEKNIDDSIKRLEQYLKMDSGIGNYKNYEILAFSTKPSNKPKEITSEEWKTLTEKIKNKKEEILENIYDIKIKVKKDLLVNFVRKIKSEFGPDISEGGWIEGVVLRDPITGEQFKIVDKDFFTKINKFNWKIRSLLKTNIAAKKASDFSGKLRERISKVLDIPEYRMRITWYTFLNKLKSSNTDPVDFIVNRIGENRFGEIKEKLIELLEYHKKLLRRFLKFYNENKDKLILKISSENDERIFRYNEEIDKRTKQSFAELFKHLNETINEVKEARNLKQIVELFVTSDELTHD